MMRVFCDPEQPFIDLNDPNPIEIRINRAEGKIWVNVGAVCMFRAQSVDSVNVKEVDPFPGGHRVEVGKREHGKRAERKGTDSSS